MPYTLPDAIIEVLKKSGHGLTAADIARRISQSNSWLGDNGQAPTRQQINSLVATRDYFVRRDDLIYHEPLWEQKRLLRLTWNDNGWHEPIYHHWTDANQDKANAAHEHKYGYGHEEWLCNDAFFHDGYQYGYIRGAQDLRNYYAGIEEAVLFTIDPVTKNRYIAGIIKNLELVSDFSAELQIAEYLFKRSRKDMMRHLREIGAVAESLGQHGAFCVRYRPEDALFYDEMLLAEFLRSDKYMRFQPYKIEGDLKTLLEQVLPEDVFQFNEGRASNKKRHERNMKAGKKEVSRLHSDITDALDRYLQTNLKSLRQAHSIELSRFGTHIADVVILHKDHSYTIMEVKTSRNARRNIREALGQLIDYSAWYPDFNITQLIIVSPAGLTRDEHRFFQRIRRVINTDLVYWQYLPDSSDDSFKIYE